MPIVHKLIGGPGTGKTYNMVQRMVAAAERYGGPQNLGFCSFTVAAREAASDEAANRFGMNPTDLRRSGHYGTIHSICHRALKVGKELLTDKKADRKWVEDSISEELSANSESSSEESGDMKADVEAFASRTPAAQALGLWHAARNRLEPLEESWRVAWEQNPKMPEWAYVEGVVQRYEDAKNRDGRVDFTDLLLKVAGKRHLVRNVDDVASEGVLPFVPAWFHDEAQDMSALSMAVFRKLISGCVEATLCADPFQNLYSFAGSHASHFLEMPAEETFVQEESRRCPQNILSLGESCISANREYFDRHIRSDRPAAEIVRADRLAPIRELVPDPAEEWLILTRTNFQASQLVARMTKEGFPWTTTAGNVPYGAPKRTRSLVNLFRLAEGFVLSAEEWADCLEMIPSRLDGEELLVRGTKKRFEPGKMSEIDGVMQVSATALHEAGASRRLVDMLENGSWKSLPDIREHVSVLHAIAQYGEELVLHPKVSVGTIHSAKGLESRNVLLYTPLTGIVKNAMRHVDGVESENRLWYVGVTRAKERLVIAESKSRLAKTMDYQLG